jgi:hypothetical protein
LSAPIKFGTSPHTIPKFPGSTLMEVKPSETLPAYTQLYYDNSVPKDNNRILPAYTLPSPKEVPNSPTPRYSVLFPATTNEGPNCATSTASSSRSSSPSPPARGVSPSGSSESLGSVAMKREVSPPPGVMRKGREWLLRKRVVA